MGILLPQVGARSGYHGGEELAQDAVFVQAGHRGQAGLDALAQLFLHPFALLGQGGVEARVEQGYDVLRYTCVAHQRGFDIGLAERKTQLLEVTCIGAQHADGACIQVGREHQLIEVVALHLATPGLREQRLKTRLDA